MKGKGTTIIFVLSLILMAAAATFQALEMRDYKLFETIFKSK